MHRHHRSLADVGTFAEKILINVGDRRSIWVDAGRPRGDPLEKRTLAIGREGRRDARLKQGIALNDPADTRVKPRPIEGMRHCADQSASGPPWQPRVGIQRDDVADARRRDRCSTARWHKGGVCGTAQQAIQFMELSAFAFPADPFALALIPSAPAVEKEKSLAPILR